MITGERFPIEQSTYFDFLSAEAHEIERVRQIESSAAGYDVGPDRAIWVWVTRHRDAWRRGLRESGRY